MFLQLEKDTVVVTNEGMQIPEVKSLYASDKTHSAKPFFNKCITYIYWGYKTDGTLRNYLPNHRRSFAAKQADVDVDDMISNEKVQAVIKVYLNTQTTVTEKLYENLKEDINSLLDKIKEVPWTIKQKLNIKVQIPKHAESTDMVDKYIDTIIEIDNIAAKYEAIRRADLIVEFEEKLAKKIYKEQQEEKRNTGRLFDERGS